MTPSPQVQLVRPTGSTEPPAGASSLHPGTHNQTGLSSSPPPILLVFCLRLGHRPPRHPLHRSLPIMITPLPSPAGLRCLLLNDCRPRRPGASAADRHLTPPSPPLTFQAPPRRVTVSMVSNSVPARELEAKLSCSPVAGASHLPTGRLPFTLCLTTATQHHRSKHDLEPFAAVGRHDNVKSRTMLRRFVGFVMAAAIIGAQLAAAQYPTAPETSLNSWWGNPQQMYPTTVYYAEVVLTPSSQKGFRMTADQDGSIISAG